MKNNPASTNTARQERIPITDKARFIMITITNKHTDGDEGISIMRKHSIFSNPFPITTMRTREMAIAQFLVRLRIEYSKKGLLYRELNLLARKSKTEDIKLVCCCKPQPCHGDVLKDAIEKIAAKMK